MWKKEEIYIETDTHKTKNKRNLQKEPKRSQRKENRKINIKNAKQRGQTTKVTFTNKKK